MLRNQLLSGLLRNDKTSAVSKGSYTNGGISNRVSVHGNRSVIRILSVYKKDMKHDAIEILQYSYEMFKFLQCSNKTAMYKNALSHHSMHIRGSV